MSFQEIKNYIYSLRFFILFSFLVFSFSAVFGYVGASAAPDETKKIIEEIGELLKPFAEMSSLRQFLYIYVNNSFTTLLVILLGVLFGIFPLFTLFANGEILGILAFFSRETISPLTFLAGILPHGIIEIPVFILACAIGIKIGKNATRKVFFKKKANTRDENVRDENVKKEISLGFKLFLNFLLPLLAVAAAIEAFITPIFLPK